MQMTNNATILRRELLSRVARLVYEGKLAEGIDRIPVELFPRTRASLRCCIYRDRAVIRYRLLAILGFAIEELAEEPGPLAPFAEAALARERPTAPVLTVIDEACSACVKTRYFITNACRGCMARPCVLNCPKKAIHIVNGQAVIDSAACVNCGICLKACPYHAVVHQPIPCEEACPVQAIRKDADGKEEIDHAKCISCGKCLRDCPFGAVMERSQLVDVLRRITDPAAAPAGVTALVAPALVGQFKVPFGRIVAGIRALGFSEVLEVAHGAEETAHREAEEFAERMAAGAPFFTTSCCPAWTATVARCLPELGPYVSGTPSPMRLTAAAHAAERPRAVRVFIGPCIAKKQEALPDPHVDFVLTIEELGALFVARGIDLAALPEETADLAAGRLGRRFAKSGGVTESLREVLPTDVEIRPILVDGLDAAALRRIAALPAGKEPGNLVEVMACEGGCLAGPAVVSNPKVAERELEKFLAQG